MLGINKFLRLSRYHPTNSIFGLISVIAVPIALIVSAFSLTLTVIIFITIALIFAYMRFSISNASHRDVEKDKSLVFIGWLSSSVFTLMIVFHVFVVDLLEILREENLVLLIFTILSIVCLFNAKQKANQFAQTKNLTDDVEVLLNEEPKFTTSFSGSNVFCFLCQAYIPYQGSHCVWLDCCIGSKNEKFFLSGTFFGMIALFYGSNLTLTTVCHPFQFYKTILLPDDCSDVYYQYNIALCFVSGVYSFLMAVLILLYFICQSIKYLFGIKI